jgi:hypothetical protein
MADQIAALAIANRHPHQQNLRFAEEDEDNVGGEPSNPYVKRGAKIKRPLVPNNASSFVFADSASHTSRCIS